MRRLAFMGLVALFGMAGVACNDSLEGKEVFVATLSGAEEVPARAVPANGSAQIIIEGDSIHYAIEVDDIAAITAAHIHSGVAGVNGPIRLFLYPSRQGDPAPQVTATDKRILVQATIPSSNVSGVTYQELLDQMRSGGAYVNVHTTQFPSGEMRGTVRVQ